MTTNNYKYLLSGAYGYTTASSYTLASFTFNGNIPKAVDGTQPSTLYGGRISSNQSTPEYISAMCIMSVLALSYRNQPVKMASNTTTIIPSSSQYVVGQIGIGIVKKQNEISEADYMFEENFLPTTQFSVSVANNVISIIVTNSTNENIDFNTIGLFMSANTTTSAWVGLNYLIAEYQFPTVTLAPGETISYTINHGEFSN